MSDMGLEVGPEDRLHEALVAFTGCIGEALDDICSYGLTLGESYVPFDPDPDDGCDPEDAMCSQAWVRVMGVAPAPGAVEGWAGDCAVTLQIELEVGVIRCIEIPSDGEAPTASDVLISALQSMTDMNKVHCAAMSCEVWESISTGQWQPLGPDGGQYGGIWTFTVEV